MVEAKKEKASVIVEDVEMKSPGSPETATPVVDEAAKKVERENLVFEELREHARQIEKSVNAKEQRHILRVLRSLTATRKNVNAQILRRVINSFYHSVPAQRDALLAYIEEPMDTGVGEVTKVAKSKMVNVNLLPEHDVYFHLLVVLYLLDLKNHKSVSFTFSDKVIFLNIYFSVF